MSPTQTGFQHWANLAFVSVILLSVVANVPAGQVTDRDLEIVGWVERVRLLEPEVHMDAKLDTGAETSSLDVEIIKKFRDAGKRWIRFRLIDRETGEEHIIVRERLRTVAIVRHNGERQLRPVVRMRICLSGKVLDAEVSLIDRSEFTYPLLLGRKSLESFTLIDPGNTYLSEPVCQPIPVEKRAGN